jgi:hypothetical protein
MQIKTRLRFHLSPIRIAIIKNTTTNRFWWGCGEKRNPHTLLVGMQAKQPLWKKICRLLKNLNTDLLYDPAIPLLGIYPKECDTGYSRGTCTPCLLQCYSQ